MKNLRDRVAVVTGAGSGIGRAVSLGLAREGCHLAVSDVNQGTVEETAEQVRGLGRRAIAHVVDVADRERMQRYADEVVAEYGAVHVLVNNAGVTVTAPFEEHSLEDFEWLMGINFWGVVYGCKFFLPHLKSADEAHIVNLSSLFGLVGVPAQSSYCASKFAVRGFSESLWAELSTTSVGVTSVHPGGVRTNIAKSARVSAGNEHLKARGIQVIENLSVPPERCAELIIDAVKKNKMRQLVTKETHAIELIKRLAPVWSQRVIARNYKRVVDRP